MAFISVAPLFLYYYREVILQRFECLFRMFLTHLAAFCLMEDSTREASARSKSATVCLCPWRSLPWGISGSLIYNFVCVLGRIFNFVLPDISINQQFISTKFMKKYLTARICKYWVTISNYTVKTRFWYKFELYIVIKKF
jgi:hypothetical protein